MLFSLKSKMFTILKKYLQKSIQIKTKNKTKNEKT